MCIYMYVSRQYMIIKSCNGIEFHDIWHVRSRLNPIDLRVEHLEQEPDH
jgi:hypothetical protein